MDEEDATVVCHQGGIGTESIGKSIYALTIQWPVVSGAYLSGACSRTFKLCALALPSTCDSKV